MTRLGSPLSSHWALQPDVVFLNHGSFGACPTAVMAHQHALRARLEAQPVLFLDREFESLLDTARNAVARFVGAHPADLVFVPNATHAVNTVLQQLVLKPGDELLTTNHAYNACKNALNAVARRTGATVVVVHVPFPLRSPDDVVDAVLSAVTPRTRLALLDHVTSPTAVILPLETLCPALSSRGVDVLVDGAHAPGMLPLDLNALGAAYYTGNLHKWVCAPKGAAFLWVRPDRQDGLAPLVVSHGANATRTDRSRFHLDFDWTGTWDPTAVLSVPAALDTMAGLVPGGWREVMHRNHALVLEMRQMLCTALEVDPPAPPSMLGSMASVPVAPGPASAPQDGPPRDPTALALWEQFRVEVPIFPFPSRPHRLLRVSAQLYNTPAQVQALLEGLRALGVLPGQDP
jgi:isopenicillin-N epimerase